MDLIPINAIRDHVCHANFLELAAGKPHEDNTGSNEAISWQCLSKCGWKSISANLIKEVEIDSIFVLFASLIELPKFHSIGTLTTATGNLAD